MFKKHIIYLILALFVWCSGFVPVFFKSHSWKAQSTLICQLSQAWAGPAHCVSVSSKPPGAALNLEAIFDIVAKRCNYVVMQLLYPHSS